MKDQLKGASSVEAYINAFKKGCKCVERKLIYYPLKVNYEHVSTNKETYDVMIWTQFFACSWLLGWNKQWTNHLPRSHPHVQNSLPRRHHSRQRLWIHCIQVILHVILYPEWDLFYYFNNWLYCLILYFSDFCCRYPVILSFENHCSVEQQRVMANHLINILGCILASNVLYLDLCYITNGIWFVFKLLIIIDPWQFISKVVHKANSRQWNSTPIPWRSQWLCSSQGENTILYKRNADMSLATFQDQNR